MRLERLIAEAVVLGGGEHQCRVLGHRWETAGGRMCPRVDNGGRCSQTVYVCGSCGWEDYGEPDGPGHRDCFELGPCDWSCSTDSGEGEPNV